jgi:hypothetical protein
MQLTPDQEQRLTAVVRTGAYASTEEALNAAVDAVEAAAVSGFEGTAEELASLLLTGLASRPLTASEFWGEVDRETEALLAAQPKPSRS